VKKRNILAFALLCICVFRWKQVFASQEANPYFEQWMIGATILQALKKHVCHCYLWFMGISNSHFAQLHQMSFIENLVVWIGGQLKPLSTQLAVYVNLIEQYKGTMPFYEHQFRLTCYFLEGRALNASCEKTVFVPLLSLLQQFNFLFVLDPCGRDNCTEECISLFQQLKQVYTFIDTFRL
jgi:hypothetical protein